MSNDDDNNKPPFKGIDSANTAKSYHSVPLRLTLPNGQSVSGAFVFDDDDADDQVAQEVAVAMPSIAELIKTSAHDWYRKQAEAGIRSAASPEDQTVEDDWIAEDYAELRANGRVRCFNTDVAARYDATFDALTLAGREGTRVINAHNDLSKAEAEREYGESRYLEHDDTSGLKELDSAVATAREEWKAAVAALFECLRANKHASLDVLVAFGIETPERLAIVMSDDGSYFDSAN